MFSFLEMAPRQQIYSRPGEWPYPAGLYVADLHFQKSVEIASQLGWPPKIHTKNIEFQIVFRAFS